MIARTPPDTYQIVSRAAKAINGPLLRAKIFSTAKSSAWKTGGSTRDLIGGARWPLQRSRRPTAPIRAIPSRLSGTSDFRTRSEEHTSELQSRRDLVCRLLLEKKKTTAHRSI